MSNEDDFVDIEDIQINNDDENQNNQNQNNEQNIKNENNDNNEIKNEILEKEIGNEQINQEIIINKNPENNDNNNDNKSNNDNNINDQEENIDDKIITDDNRIIDNDNIINQKNKDVYSIKNDTQTIIKKKNTFNTFDNSIHIHNPVPLSKMQLAENKYYKIKEELNKKYFNSNISEIQDETQPLDKSVLESKKYKEMISYLEQLNEVLTEILKSSRIQQKEAEKLKKKTVQKTPEQIYQEQQKMNDNQEKMIEIYKKQLTSLQNRLNQVSKENFMEELIEKNKKLDEEIEKIKITNKKLNNEQKLNEIVISKQNKNEQEDKANMLLKRMNMDYNKLQRENEKLSKKIEEYKIKELNNYRNL